MFFADGVSAPELKSRPRQQADSTDHTKPAKPYRSNDDQRNGPVDGGNHAHRRQQRDRHYHYRQQVPASPRKPAPVPRAIIGPPAAQDRRPLSAAAACEARGERAALRVRATVLFAQREPADAAALEDARRGPAHLMTSHQLVIASRHACQHAIHPSIEPAI